MASVTDLINIWKEALANKYSRRLAEFFTEDYGDPKTTENPKESLYSGIEVENERAEWDLENGKFRLEKYSLTNSSGLFFACTREWIEQLAVEDAEVDLTQLHPEDEP